MEASKNTSNVATDDLNGQMSHLQISQMPGPVLDGLMKWHLYIGYSWEDRQIVKELHAILHSKGLECKLRSSLDVKEQAQEDNIKQGIIFSHKCLLFISPDYLKDPKSQQELKEAEKKLKFLGKNSVFGIVQSNVDPAQIERYEQFQLIFLSLSEQVEDCSRAIRDCLNKYQDRDAILKDYELKMELQLGPKENIGVGVAYTYFFGFLQMVVPGVWKKFREAMENTGINDDNLVKKMLVIIRKSVNPPARLKEPGVEQTKFSIKQTFARAGKDNREYTLYAYKLAANDQRNKNDLYFIADFPACLFALREVFDYELNTTMMRKDEVFEARNEFVLTVKALLSHQDNQAKFGNQWELLLWPDDEEDHRVELNEFLHQQIESKRLTKLSQDGSRQPVNQVVDGVTFKRGRGLRDYPMYYEGEQYDLKDSSRGYCVIISNYYFLTSGLNNRDGGLAEISELEKLFKTLRFQVCIYRNLTGEAIKTELAKYSNEKDHSGSDAFVCCLLSHGSKGRIFGTDGDSISVVELMELFYDDKCPGLKEKPKLFFIGACQVGESVADDERPDTSFQATSATSMPSYTGLGDRSESLNTQADAVPEKFSPNVMRDLIPSTVDFIVSYACLPYTKALRDKEKGGYYAQALCKHLTRDLEIDVALRHVNKEVRALWDVDTKKEGMNYSRPDPFHIIMPPQKFLFLSSISENKQ